MCVSGGDRVDVLVTGASGRIGSQFVATYDGVRLRLRRADLRDAQPEHRDPFVRLDVTEPAPCRAACRGMDAVLHLAGDPSPQADFRSAVLPVNMVGTYNLVESALAAGVRRFVFASSVQAVEGYPVDYQVRESDPACPVNDYGVGKAFGEALCAAAANRSRTTFVSVRIGNYAEQRPASQATLRDRMAWLSPRDAVQLLTLALTAPVDGHHVVHGVSNNAVKRLSLDCTRRLLRYQPHDDAFACDAGAQVRNTRRLPN